MAAAPFRLSKGLPLNPFIAIDLAWGAGHWDIQSEAFRDCWDEIVADFDPDLDLGYGRLGALQLRRLVRECRLSTYLVEELIGEYLDRLPAECEASANRLDPKLIADALVDNLLGVGRIGDACVEYYRHNWKIPAYYQNRGLCALVPLFLAVNNGLPLLGDVPQIYKIAERISSKRSYLPDLLREGGLPTTARNVRFIHFLAYNSPDAVLDLDDPLNTSPISSVSPGFWACVENFDFTKSVGLQGLQVSRRFDLEGVKVEIDPIPFLRAIGRGDMQGEAAAEVTLKALAISKLPTPMRNGLPAATYNLIEGQLRAAGRILSVAELRRVRGMENLSVDPYSIDPGPIVCYAPGDRYLRGDAVAFALRDWVADDGHRRSRIGRDRILTPLTAIRLPNAGTIASALTNLPLHRRGMLAFRSDLLRRVQPQCPAEAGRWVKERCRRLVDNYAETHGYHLQGEVLFHRPTWGIASKRLTAAVARERLADRFRSRRFPQGVRLDEETAVLVAQEGNVFKKAASPR